MKTSNQYKIQQLEEENRLLKEEVEYYKKTIQQIENKSIWDSVKNKENIKYISEEIILYLDKYKRGDVYEKIKESEKSNIKT